MLSESPSGREVPQGIKESVLFVLNNEANVSRQARGGRAFYADDCGVWSNKASCKTNHYILKGNNLDYVDKKDGLYLKYNKDKRVPIEPQPDSSNIIVFKRYYISLKRDPSFKKRISTVTECPEE